MANDLGSAVNMLKGLLGDNAEDKIQSLMQGLGANNDVTADSAAPSPTPMPNTGHGAPDGDTLQYIMRMKSIIDEMSHADDDRTRLLMSLRPYMRAGRQKSIDNALKIMALTKLSGVFSKL